jgi:signal transduction histidine kinase
LPELVRGVVAAHADRQPAPTLNTDGVQLRVCADPDRFGMIIGHVIRNAQDATPADGRVAVDVRREGDSAVIEVSDSGAGMSADFLRSRLFKPFDSTKGARGMGIGAYQVRQFVEEAGGEVRVESRPGEGTRFELRLPLADPTREAAPVPVGAENGKLQEGKAVSG